MWTGPLTVHAKRCVVCVLYTCKECLHWHYYFLSPLLPSSFFPPPPLPLPLSLSPSLLPSPSFSERAKQGPALPRESPVSRHVTMSQASRPPQPAPLFSNPPRPILPHPHMSPMGGPPPHQMMPPHMQVSGWDMQSLKLLYNTYLMKSFQKSIRKFHECHEFTIAPGHA